MGGVDATEVLPTTADEDAEERADRCDEVRLWEDGWRARYYQSKFGVDPVDAPEFCIKVAHEYVIGLCWVLAYYYQVSYSTNRFFVFKPLTAIAFIMFF